METNLEINNGFEHMILLSQWEDSFTCKTEGKTTESNMLNQQWFFLLRVSTDEYVVIYWHTLLISAMRIIPIHAISWLNFVYYVYQKMCHAELYKLLFENACHFSIQTFVKNICNKSIATFILFSNKTSKPLVHLMRSGKAKHIYLRSKDNTTCFQKMQVNNVFFSSCFRHNSDNIALFNSYHSKPQWLIFFHKRQR